MTQISKSLQRNTFQKEKFLERQAEKGLTPENDQETKEMNDYYLNWSINQDKKEENPEWQKNNMEYDLRTCDWMLEKVRACECYAQNLYAAMCNNDFQKLDVVTILKDQTWSCSWRHAGGIIADMQERGDYIDWYCSGIRDTTPLESDERDKLTEEQRARYEITNKYVGESVVTDEIRADLRKLGWIVLDTQDQD